VDIGRIDICFAVSLMSSYLVNPREGHFYQVLHIFGYLKRNIDYTLIMSPLDRSTVPTSTVDWSDFYPNARESIPTNMPEPRGHSVNTFAYVDADHGGDITTRRSHSGILIFIQDAAVMWYCKKQATVEASTHGVELVATRIAVELIEGLRYKLRMFGVPINGPTIIFCDNTSVVHNGTKPDSVLKKKHNSISFHIIRESAAAGFIQIVSVRSEDNLADILTKVLSGSTTQRIINDILIQGAG